MADKTLTAAEVTNFADTLTPFLRNVTKIIELARFVGQQNMNYIEEANKASAALAIERGTTVTVVREAKTAAEELVCKS